MNGQDLDTETVRTKLFSLMQRDAAFETKAERALELGRAYLGVENAHLTKIDRKVDYWETIASTDPEEGPFPPGLVLDLQTTYCRRTIDAESSVALHDAPSQGWEDDPAYETHGLHCYLGTPLIVAGDEYGTVCFVSEEPRPEPFSSDEILFVELAGRMLERELRRRHREVELDRRERLISVLTRILRHNLRNDMTLVRAHVERIVHQSDGAVDGSQPLLETIDGLIRLSEKAQELESIITSEFEHREIPLDALVRSRITALENEYPAASITLDETETATIYAMVSLETAVHEVIENAAKHSGESPSVNVSTDATRTAARISVTDDGPGLPEQERRVLQEGGESPLVHGSGIGLWTAHWIVTGHDGTIETSVSDEGTTVTLTIPRPYGNDEEEPSDSSS